MPPEKNIALAAHIQVFIAPRLGNLPILASTVDNNTWRKVEMKNNFILVGVTLLRIYLGSFADIDQNIMRKNTF